MIDLYGDSSAIRELARRLDEQAGDIAAEADRLMALAEACPWSGWAADAMRRRTRLRAASLRRSSGRHLDAAQALGRHADAVDRAQELIATVERKAASLLDELGQLAKQALPDGWPPPGHRDWLGVDLRALLP